MKNPYLIQRGEFKNIPKDKITGIDSLILQDYMGSSEFEFGALPASLKAIMPNLDDFEFLQTKHKPVNTKSGNLYIICNKVDANDVMIIVDKLVDNERQFHLKERTKIKDALNSYPINKNKTESKKSKKEFQNELYSTNINFWWDIGNHWMACFGEINAENVLYALNKLRERWIKEKKI